MAQAILEFDAHPAHPATGFELGWDFAHHAVTPPVDHLQPGSPLRHGWEAGRVSFGARTLEPTRHVRKWLQLRLSAWARGRAFEGVQVTPNYLKQIDVAWCPVTRERLTHQTGEPSDASVDRVRNDAGYAAGNLAVMSTRANAAKGQFGFDQALSAMRESEARGLEPVDGLTAGQWSRVALLCSFVTELPHAQAAGLPLLLMPPNRLRLHNPIQALQAIVTRAFVQPDWRRRVAALAALLPGKVLRRDFQVFVHALLPRVLEARRPTHALEWNWILEDAWHNPLVLRCWTRVARQLNADQAEQIVLRACAKRLCTQRVESLSQARATEGWALETRGYMPRGCQPFAHADETDANGARPVLPLHTAMPAVPPALIEWQMPPA